MYQIDYQSGPMIKTEYVKASTCTQAVKILMNLLRTRGMPVNLQIHKVKNVKK